jgi:hypothetical protein
LKEDSQLELKQQQDILITNYESKMQALKDKMTREKHEELEKERNRGRARSMDRSELMEQQVAFIYYFH